MTTPSPENRDGEYLNDPTAIYRESFEIIRCETDLSGFTQDEAEIAVRIVHACGMTDIVEDLRFSGSVGQMARDALESGAPVFVDCTMAGSAIIRRNLPRQNDVICTLSDPRTPIRATAHGMTRSAAAVEFWRDQLAGAVVVVGNAPTALFALLELIREGGPRPAAILAFPVGFVGAAESKQALVGSDVDIPYATLLGRRGGSAMAGAALNAALVGSRDR